MTFEASLNLATLLLAGAMSAMLAGVLWWYATPLPQAHYRHWTSAWLAQAAYYLIGALTFTLAMRGVSSGTLRPALSVTTQVANTLAAVLLVVGALGFVRREPVSPRALRLALLVSLTLGAVVALLATGSGNGSLLRSTYRALITAASFLGSGVIIWRHRTERARADDERPAQLLALSLAAFGLAQAHYLAYWVLTLAGSRPAYGLVWFTLIDLLWLAAIAIATGAIAVGDQREAAAMALSDQERAFRQMIEHSSDITAVLDAARCLQYVSPSAARVLGWDADIVGRSVAEFVHPDDQAALAARIRAPEPSTTPIVLRVRTKRGQWMRVEAVSRRWQDEQGREIVIVNARDVSERERLESSLREAQKLESVGRLAGGVAHDLNNILMVIGSEVQLAYDDAPEEVRTALHHIGDATDRAADLTRQLLTFARRRAVQPRVVDVGEAIAGTARMAGRLLPASITLHVEPADAGLTALIDPTQLEQVAMNLIVNARDAIAGAHAESGQVTLAVRERALAEDEEPGMPPGRYVAFTVQDTGAGIPDDVRPHVFEPFFTTKAEGDGTGLGLATSYGIVRQAGGCVRFESTVGAGTTFEVLLPYADGSQVTRTADAPASSPARGEVVRVGEAVDAGRALEVRALTRAGFTVHEAADGAAAIACAEALPTLRVLVSDVIMPRVGGRELARRLRARDASLGVLFLSGYPGDPEFERSLPEGARFLQKPVSPDELVRVVLELVGSR
jgi:PAS domain S-box-containing protein